MAFRGSVDTATRSHVRGWAQDTEQPDLAISLILTIDGRTERVLADVHRPDLETAGIGNGRHAYHVDFRPKLSPLTPHVVEVRRESTGVHLPGSPATIEAATAFDAAARDQIAALIAASELDEDLDGRIEFLLKQTDLLLQMRADHRSGRQDRLDRRSSRWRTSYEQRSDDEAPSTAGPRRALVIDKAIPVESRDAGSRAILAHMRSLQRLGFEVTFLPSDLSLDQRDALTLEGVACYGRPWFASVEEVFRREAGEFDLVYLHRVSNASQYAALARAFMPKARIVYAVADLHHVRTLRQAHVEGRPELIEASKRIENMEIISMFYADAVIVHSRFEADLLRQRIPPTKVHEVLWSVPSHPTEMPFADRRGFAFIAGYDHPPNVDAAHWLVDAVLPHLRRLGGADIPLLLVGSNMPDSLKRLSVEGVVPLGWVPDLHEIFDRVRLTVAPLAFGAGIKGKVLDSLAAGVPCVGTPIAFEGLDLPAIIQEQSSITPETFARRIYALHTDRELNEACGSAGLAFTQSALSEHGLDAALKRAIGG